MTTLNKPAKTETTEKYTAEQTKTLLQEWADFCAAVPNWANADRAKTDEFISRLAKKFMKGERSIIGKLTRHQVYSAKTQVKQSSNTTKAEIASTIGKVLNLSEPETESLAVAGKSALNKIFQALANSKPLEAISPEELENRRNTISEISSALGLENTSIRELESLTIPVLSDIAEGIEGIRTDYDVEINDLNDEILRITAELEEIQAGKEQA